MSQTTYHSWILRFFLAVIFFVALMGGVNFLIDPLGVTPYNFLHLENKDGNDVRKIKVRLAKEVPHIDNVILGSSRAMSFGGEASETLGGVTFNFGVHLGKTEDFLGILLFLESIDKFPKNVILGLDEISFSPYLEPHAQFVSNDDLNFLRERSLSSLGLYVDRFLTLDAMMGSAKVVYKQIRKEPVSEQFNALGVHTYFDKEERAARADYLLQKEVEKESDIYFEKFLTRGHYDHLSEERVEYLRRVVALCSAHHSRLFVFLTPVHPYHYARIMNNETLRDTMGTLKDTIGGIVPFVDFLNEGSDVMAEKGEFISAVHYNPEGAKLIMTRLLAPGDPSLPLGFGRDMP